MDLKIDVPEEAIEIIKGLISEPNIPVAYLAGGVYPKLSKEELKELYNKYRLIHIVEYPGTYFLLLRG